METSQSQRRSGCILAVLVLVNITCECSRYLFNYLSAVSLVECKEACAARAYTPICRADPAVIDVCRECRVANQATYFSILEGSCITRAEYGLLAGPAFALVYAAIGVFAGRLTDAYDSRMLHFTAIVLWSLAVLSMGVSRAFWHMLMARLLLGIGESFQAPCSYALIAQSVPLSSRSRANGIYSFGIYVGGGAASLSILLAKHIGWRHTCLAYGLVSMGVGLLYGMTVGKRDGQEEGAYVLARRCCSFDGGADSSAASAPPPTNAEPCTDQERPGMVGALRTLVHNRRVLLLLAASSIRFYAGNSIAAFLPVYMGRAFPADNSHYSFFNALIVCLGGAAAAYAGGHAADAWAKSQPRAHALMPCLGSLLAILPWAGVMYSPHFATAMLCLLLEYLAAEGWLGPALTILQGSLPAEVQGLGVGVLLLCCTLVGELAPVLIARQDPGDAMGLAPVLFWHVATAYAISGGVFLALAMTVGSADEAAGSHNGRDTTSLSTHLVQSGGGKPWKRPDCATMNRHTTT